MKNTQTKNKILSFALAFSLIISVLSLNAFAENIQPTKTITAFTEPSVIQIANGDVRSEEEIMAKFPTFVLASVDGAQNVQVPVSAWVRVYPTKDVLYTSAVAGEFFYAPSIDSAVYTLAQTAILPNQKVQVGETLHQPQTIAEKNLGDFTITGTQEALSGCTFNNINNRLEIRTIEPITISNTDSSTPTASSIYIAAPYFGDTKPANITLNNVNIEMASSSAIVINGGYSVNITITGTNKLLAGNNTQGAAGILVPENSSLTITDKSTGTLTATANINSGASAGIGGVSNGPFGVININGGTIIATGNDRGAGIGGASTSGGEININGGTVTATGGASANGIGGNGAKIKISGETTKVTATVAESVSGSLDNAGIGGENATIEISGGTVNATGDSSGPGIGGKYFKQITISGGTIIANGKDNAAGIGDIASMSGKIYITGGNITAKSGNDGAGIGGGVYGDSGEINISGDTTIVNATGGENAAGIGGGNRGNGGIINISGGVITATGGDGGAGIGGGSNGDGGTITISGNAIIELAQGGTDGAGIGGGYDSNGGKITISGNAKIELAQGGDGGAGIGGGINGDSGTFTTTDENGAKGNAFIIAVGGGSAKAISDDDATKKASWSGVIFENNDDGLVYGTPTLATNAEIPRGKTLNIESGKTLTIGASATLTNSGTLTCDGMLTGQGSLSGSGSFQTNVLKSEYIPGIQTDGYLHSGNVISVNDAIQNPTILGKVFVVNGWLSNGIEKQDANGTTWSASTVQDIGNYRVVYKNSRYADIVIPFKVSALGIIKGEHQTILRGESISFTSNAEFVDYVDTELTKGGTTAPQTIHSAATGDSKDVTAQNGSIIVTLSSAYTATLPLGTHTISINSASGSAITTFTVTEETTTSETYNPAISPLTGVYNK